MPKGVNGVDSLFEVQLIDEATMKLLINCELAVYRHLRSTGRDVNPEDIKFCRMFFPSEEMILKYGDTFFSARRTDDRKSIEITEYEPAGGSIWDVLSADGAES
jgi:hypothetical protein